MSRRSPRPLRAFTSRARPRTVRGCSSTASGCAGSRRSMPASTCGRRRSPRAPAAGAGLTMTRTAGVSFSADHTAVDHLTDLVSAGKVTLLFGAHDIERSGPCSSAARCSRAHRAIANVRRREGDEAAIVIALIGSGDQAGGRMLTTSPEPALASGTTRSGSVPSSFQPHNNAVALADRLPAN